MLDFISASDIVQFLTGKKKVFFYQSKKKGHFNWKSTFREFKPLHTDEHQFSWFMFCISDLLLQVDIVRENLLQAGSPQALWTLWSNVFYFLVCWWCCWRLVYNISPMAFRSGDGEGHILWFTTSSPLLKHLVSLYALCMGVGYSGRDHSH